MVKKTTWLIIIFVLIVLTAIGALIFQNFNKAKLGEKCGFDFGECNFGLSCDPVGKAETGNMFGICIEGSNDREVMESCGPEYIGCCEEGLFCVEAGSPIEGGCVQSLGINDVLIDEKPCFD